MTRIVYDNFHLGGIADSKYSGLPNSAYKLVGFNLHEEPGVLKVQQAIASDVASGDAVTQKIRAIVPVASGGKTYLFGHNGIVWERNSSAVYDALAVVAPSAGDHTIFDAVQFGAYIYYTMPQRLGKWEIGTAWATRDDDFQTLSADDEFHPLKVIEDKLYIGHLNLVGTLDNDHTTFTSAALTLETKYTIQTFGKLDTNLIIGTITEGSSAGSFSGFSHIFNWDLRSIDLSSDVTIEEFGVNCIMNYQGSMLIQAGSQGNWYSYNGQSIQRYKRFPGDWSGVKAGVTEANAVSSYRGIPMIGFSNETSNPALQGVYSFGSYDPKYPTVFNFDFPSVLGGSDDTEIGAVARIGTDLVFSRAVGGSAYAVMKVDTANKYDGAYLETQMFNVDQDKFKTVDVKICYRSLPAGSTITLAYDKNDTGSYTNATVLTHDNKSYIRTSIKLTDVNNIQFKVSTTRGTDTNTAPEIMSVIVDFNTSEK